MHTCRPQVEDSDGEGEGEADEDDYDSVQHFMPKTGVCGLAGAWGRRMLAGGSRLVHLPAHHLSARGQHTLLASFPSTHVPLSPRLCRRRPGHDGGRGGGGASGLPGRL